MELPDELYMEVAKFTDVYTFHRFRKVNRKLFDLLIADTPVAKWEVDYEGTVLSGAKWHRPHGSDLPVTVSSQSTSFMRVWMYNGVELQIQCYYTGRVIFSFLSDSLCLWFGYRGHVDRHGEHRKIDNPSWAGLRRLLQLTLFSSGQEDGVTG